ncbi:hypothetical protein [Thermocoleostomius sinensis]|uniref:Chromosome segregation ATPase n=1 Tax=Thermocoleostomius sinensis A174 TaxID=2016057 RepID=A0A9E8ZIL0_9CYAN|nr:hypothetical protein [Thermocoleostomius sinensis]WAL61920.1 hypothetical protein OXH18_08030 [Thermocoleostomius sinensis A174]
MTQNHGTPDYPSEAGNLDKAQSQAKPPASQSGRAGIPAFVPLSQPYTSLYRQSAVPQSPEARTNPEYSASSTASSPSISTSASSIASAAPIELPLVTEFDDATNSRSRFSLQFPKNWLFWGITSAVAFSGLGIISAMTLFRLPSLPNCPAIFWPTASASLRIYCAQLSAERRTVEDLLKAIALVNSLPENHALRPEIDRNIEAWSKEILALADETFQQGDLDKAIATAKRIPNNTEAAGLVTQQIKDWQTIWANAEAIYQDSIDALKQQDLRKAFSIATRLLGVDNDFWQTTKYRELNTLITVTRQDSDKLNKAKGLADQGGLDNLLAAIKLAEEVRSSSPLAARAQQAIADFGEAMLDLAQATLDQRDYEGALAVVQQIPARAGVQDEVKDFRSLAEAQVQAWGGTTDDIQAAISRAQRIERDRPLYNKAQQLISYWQLEIEDVQRLGSARQLAQGGSLGDLRAAIAEASLIPSFNPRGAEAQQAINEWQTTIETAEDRPYLDRAMQLASQGDINSLQAAIDEARRIGHGRALSEEADTQIAAWRGEIQRIQDQPLLNRARLLANNGNLVEAIDVAGRISSGRALYDEAQSDIADWSAQMQRSQDQPVLDLARQYARQGNLAQAIRVAEQISTERVLYDEAQAEIQTWRGQFSERDRLQQAYSTANAGTPAMLLSAIQLANEVPTNDSVRAEANRMISQWSWRILEMARSQANYDVAGAIATARSIPSYAEAYAAAQQQIQEWQQRGRQSPSPRVRLE